MQIQTLDQKHPTYDADLWADVSALYAGGKKFRERLNRMLIQNPMEPADVYRKRQEEACYRSYLGPIIDYYAAWLFSDALTIRSLDKTTGEAVEVDDWYAKFKEDVGNDKDMSNFVRERFTEALQKQHAHWLVEFPNDGAPPPVDKAEFTQRKLGNARLRKVDREDLYDWECTEEGDLVWCIVHSQKLVRPDPRRPRDTVVETWEIFDAGNVETFILTYKKGERPPKETEVPSQGVRPHGAKRVPLVTLKVSDGLWIGGRVFAPQLEHFRLSCALTWAIRRSCYAMPILKIENGDNPPAMGTGYYLKMGIKESFEWAAPPDGPFAVIAGQVDTQRDEIYRITHQLALSVDGSTTAVGRSGESKEADSLATRVMLIAYGSDVREAVEETFEIVSDGRGDEDITFSVEGLDDFETTAPADLVATATSADILNIPSPTFRKELYTRVAFALIPDVDQKTRETIKTEIDEGVDEDIALKEEMQKAQLEGVQNPEEPAAGEGGGAPVPNAQAA